MLDSGDARACLLVDHANPRLTEIVEGAPTSPQVVSIRLGASFMKTLARALVGGLLGWSYYRAGPDFRLSTHRLEQRARHLA